MFCGETGLSLSPDNVFKFLVYTKLFPKEEKENVFANPKAVENEVSTKSTRFEKNYQNAICSNRNFDALD